MGAYWHSYAVVISTQPEVIKQLIEEAANIYKGYERVSEGSEDVTNVYDLTIDGNCILFHSDGYGCYGTDFEDVRMMLFEFLFENYDKALVCYEMVESRQTSVEYAFSASWGKPDGEVDWDDDETFHIYRRVTLNDKDEDEGQFDMGEIWFLPIQAVNQTMPNLAKLVNLAKKTGFSDWAVDPHEYDSEPVILTETLWEISTHLEDELDDYDENLVFDAYTEVKEDYLNLIDYIELDSAEFELPFELPEKFEILIAGFRKNVLSSYRQYSSNNNDEKQKQPDACNGLTLRLRTKNNLMELLQAGKSGAWKVAKGKEKQISHVQIFNWDGSMMLVAAHDVSNSFRRSEDSRLVVALDSKGAKIIKCDPLFQWVGQNPVNYVKETSATSKNDLVEGENTEKDSKSVANQTEFIEPAPHAPEGLTDLSPHLAELCESVYEEPVRLIHWQMKDNNGEQQFSTLFRECRRGWYFQMLLTQNKDKWSSNHRVLPSFLNLLDPDETTWAKLTESATAEDWYALDEIFLNTIIFPNSRVIFAGSDLVGEEVADEAMEKFSFYVPDEDLLPVLLFESRNLGVSLISYFRHSDGFAKENMVSDDNTDVCEVYESLTEAQKRLNQKLSYYRSEA